MRRRRRSDTRVKVLGIGSVEHSVEEEFIDGSADEEIGQRPGPPSPQAPSPERRDSKGITQRVIQRMTQAFRDLNQVFPGDEDALPPPDTVAEADEAFTSSPTSIPEGSSPNEAYEEDVYERLAGSDDPTP